jgi:hypothetical protein
MMAWKTMRMTKTKTQMMRLTRVGSCVVLCWVLSAQLHSCLRCPKLTWVHAHLLLIGACLVYPLCLSCVVYCIALCYAAGKDSKKKTKSVEVPDWNLLNGNKAIWLRPAKVSPGCGCCC